MTTPAGIQPIGTVPSKPDAAWFARLVAAVNALIGKSNCTADVTLTASDTTTLMQDARLSAFSILTFMPVTANAAAAKPDLYVTDQKTGQALINHASSADVDQTFRVGIFG